MRTASLIACIVASAVASSVATSGLWWSAAASHAAQSADRPRIAQPLQLVPRMVAGPARRAPAATPISVTSPGNAPAAEQGTSLWGQTTATWGTAAPAPLPAQSYNQALEGANGEVAAAVQSPPDSAAAPEAAVAHDDGQVHVMRAPEPAPQAQQEEPQAPIARAAELLPGDGTVPPAYFVDCGVTTADSITFAPSYCARYGLTQEELLMLSMASHQCGHPLEEVIEVYFGRCARIFDAVVIYYQIDPSVFFVVLEPGITVHGPLHHPYLWYDGGCVGPTNFSNSQYQALIALKIGCDWAQCPQADIVTQITGGLGCGQVLGNADAWRIRQGDRDPHHLRPILRRPGAQAQPIAVAAPQRRPSAQPTTGGWGVSHASSGWEEPRPVEPAKRLPSREPTVREPVFPVLAAPQPVPTHERTTVVAPSEGVLQRERAREVAREPIRAAPVEERPAPAPERMAPILREEPQHLVAPEAPRLAPVGLREVAPQRAAPERPSPSPSRDQQPTSAGIPGR